MCLGEDVNSLYVASFNSNSVLRYDIVHGHFIDTFASVNGPVNLVFGPEDLNLYVTSDNSVLRYNGKTGAFMDTFAMGDRPDELLRGLTFGPRPDHDHPLPDNDLYVVSRKARGPLGEMPSRVLRYHGTTGALVGVIVPPGGGEIFFTTEDLVFGPDRNLYITGEVGNSLPRIRSQVGGDKRTEKGSGPNSNLTLACLMRLTA
jgi:hypothetical protein